VFRGQTLNLKARRIFLRGPGDFNCPPPGPSRLILPVGMLKLSKLTGNAVPMTYPYKRPKKTPASFRFIPPRQLLPKTVMRSHDTSYAFMCIRVQLWLAVGDCITSPSIGTTPRVVASLFWPVFFPRLAPSHRQTGSPAAVGGFGRKVSSLAT